MKAKRFLFLMAGIVLAMVFTFSACSSDSPSNPNGGGEPSGESSMSQGGESSSDTFVTQSSSSKTQTSSNLYCDYGPVTEFGGGCFSINNASECDTRWGSVVSACNNDPPPTQQSSSSIYVPPTQQSSNSGTSGNPPSTAPGGLTVNATSESAITVSWGSVSGANSYNLYYTLGAALSSGIFSKVSVTGTQWNSTNATPATEYCFKVSAVNSNGEGPVSAVKCATTQSGIKYGKVTFENGVNTNFAIEMVYIKNSSDESTPIWEEKLNITYGNSKTYNNIPVGTYTAGCRYKRTNGNEAGICKTSDPFTLSEGKTATVKWIGVDLGISVNVK